MNYLITQDHFKENNQKITAIVYFSKLTRIQQLGRFPIEIETQISKLITYSLAILYYENS